MLHQKSKPYGLHVLRRNQKIATQEHLENKDLHDAKEIKSDRDYISPLRSFVDENSHLLTFLNLLVALALLSQSIEIDIVRVLCTIILMTIIILVVHELNGSLPFYQDDFKTFVFTQAIILLTIILGMYFMVSLRMLWIPLLPCVLLFFYIFIIAKLMFILPEKFDSEYFYWGSLLLLIFLSIPLGVLLYKVSSWIRPFLQIALDEFYKVFASEKFI